MNKASFFELIEPGTTLDLGSHTFEAAEIIEFARRFDPQPFHLSEESARDSLFGRLCASGWHTGAMWMKLNITQGRRQLQQLTGLENLDGVFGPSPGLRNLKWPAPVYAGDTVRFFTTIASKRVLPNKPGWGLLIDESGGNNQHGKPVLSVQGAATVRLD